MAQLKARIEKINNNDGAHLFQGTPITDTQTLTPVSSTSSKIVSPARTFPFRSNSSMGHIVAKSLGQAHVFPPLPLTIDKPIPETVNKKQSPISEKTLSPQRKMLSTASALLCLFVGCSAFVTMLQLFTLSTFSSDIRSKGFAEFDMDKRKLGQLNITNDNDERPGLEESNWDQDLRRQCYQVQKDLFLSCQESVGI